jgi:hypothetical protein
MRLSSGGLRKDVKVKTRKRQESSRGCAKPGFIAARVVLASRIEATIGRDRQSLEPALVGRFSIACG